MKALWCTVAVLIAVLWIGPGAASGAVATDGARSAASAKSPPPPQFPKNFAAKGRWVVPDLGVDVPLTWQGSAGDSQMTAGSDKYPIYFTNIISGGYLYTLTYKWPGIARRPCSRVGPFTIDDLNKFLKTARYVGPETLEGRPSRHVNHWRVGVVWEPPPAVLPPAVITPVGGTPAAGEGAPVLRIGLMEGDFYVDQKDATTFWKVLHFGVQNLYDPQLDEWAVLNSFAHRAGKVTVPTECTAAPAPAAP